MVEGGGRIVSRRTAESEHGARKLLAQSTDSDSPDIHIADQFMSPWLLGYTLHFLYFLYPYCNAMVLAHNVSFLTDATSFRKCSQPEQRAKPPLTRLLRQRLMNMYENLDEPGHQWQPCMGRVGLALTNPIIRNEQWLIPANHLRAVSPVLRTIQPTI